MTVCAQTIENLSAFAKRFLYLCRLLRSVFICFLFVPTFLPSLVKKILLKSFVNVRGSFIISFNRVKSFHSCPKVPSIGDGETALAFLKRHKHTQRWCNSTDHLGPPGMFQCICSRHSSVLAETAQRTHSVQCGNGM